MVTVPFVSIHAVVKVRSGKSGVRATVLAENERMHWGVLNCFLQIKCMHWMVTFVLHARMRDY
jgi:hypothetical protein